MRATLAADVTVGWSRRPPPPPAPAMPFVLAAMLSSTVAPATPYMAIGYNTGEAATFDECATLLQDDQELTSWSVQLTTALTGTQTLVASISVDGVDDVTMPISMAVGDTGGIADGALAIPAGALVAIHYTFGGGLAVKGVRGCVLAFDGIPFLVEAARAQLTVAGFAIQGSADQRTDGGDYEQISATSVTGSLHPLPGNVTITGTTVHTESVVVPPASWTHHIGMAGASQGSMIVPAAQQDGEADWSTLWPPTVGAGDCNASMAYHQPPNATYDNVRFQLATRYEPAAPYDEFSFIMSGLGAGIFQEGDTAHVLPGSDTGTDSSSVPLRWPNLPGTFRHLVGYSKASNVANPPTSIDYTLNVDGVDEITAASGPIVGANPVYAREDVSSFHVTGGELVHFTGTITGTTINVLMGAAIGFLPD